MGRVLQAKGQHSPMVSRLLPKEFLGDLPQLSPIPPLPRSRSCTCSFAAPSSSLTSYSTLRSGYSLNPARGLQGMCP